MSLMDAKEEIRRRIDIADLIGESLDLKPSGSGSFKAVCPFHAEKTPSFHVSREKQIWHCFGCGEGGDCFSFVMKMEGVEFSEALRLLGKRAGVEVPRFSSIETNERDRFVRINTFAAACYQKILQTLPSAAVARAYVQKRGMDADLQETFGIGFAPDAWDTLARLFERKGFSLLEAEHTGLFLRRKSGSGFIDRFRNRLMIPLRDPHGSVVGFAGRLLPRSDGSTAEDAGPKYLNSPETAAYRKGEFLFGLDLAKAAIKTEKSVILVEGNLDVVASHKAGVRNVVASSGTALTERQLSLLRRYTDTLIFALDRDAAGGAAARRVAALAHPFGFQLKAAVLPPGAGKDPDEAVQKDPELWRQAVSGAVPVMQYLMVQALEGKDLARVEDKRAAASLLITDLLLLDSEVERDHWIQRAADLLGADRAALRADVEKARKAPHLLGGKTDQKVRGPAAPPAAAATTIDSERRTRAHVALEAVLALCLHRPEWQTEAFVRLDPARLPEGESRELYTSLVPEYAFSRFSLSTEQETYFGWMSGKWKEDPARARLLPLLRRLALQGETVAAGMPDPEAHRQLEAHLVVLDQAFLETERKHLETEIRRAEAKGDQDAVQALLAAYASLR
ncbi:MAG TPA: DNA primase [Patescibacteria group bacterium]|nr:DNA primase [Patescibacteria group bacterium]